MMTLNTDLSEREHIAFQATVRKIMEKNKGEFHL
jgi:hypothetical protein